MNKHTILTEVCKLLIYSYTGSEIQTCVIVVFFEDGIVIFPLMLRGDFVSGFLEDMT